MSFREDWDWAQRWGHEREFRRQANESLGLVFCMIFGPLIFVATCCGLNDYAHKVSGGCGCVNVRSANGVKKDAKVAAPDTGTVSYDEYVRANARRLQLQRQIDSLQNEKRLLNTK